MSAIQGPHVERDMLRAQRLPLLARMREAVVAFETEPKDQRG